MARIAAVALALVLGGCPPTGEPPAYQPTAVDARSSRDAMPDAAPTPDTGEPDGKVSGPDMAVERPECVDHDNDGRVEAEDCDGLPGGDCAPMDGERFPGAEERCNLVDDNCNGQTDEGEPEAGDDCVVPDAEGVCARGATVCDGGEVTCESVERAALTDDCDGLDEDCDGTVDEDAADQGRCETGDDGICAAGLLRCVGGEFACVASDEPGPEACNALDDDCDGTTDEGDPGGGAACETELLGLCRNGVLACAGGNVVCTQTVDPVPEVCNGLDDNCDGESDETFDTLGDACRVGVGACARDSAFVCNEAGDGVECDASAGNGNEELCNGLDDDCDEVVDEGFDVGGDCAVGVGECLREGSIGCADDVAVCDAEPGDPAEEVCNGLDDNCDGEADEGFPVGDDCVDDSGQCDSPGVLDCDDGGGVVCVAEPVLPGAETCNDFDDDCDDSVDEDFPTLGDPCEVGAGECLRAGEVVCGDDGGATCSVGAADAVQELCNGLDDDCDGRIDNDAPCLGAPVGQVVGFAIADAADERCADNGLGALAATLNPLLAADYGDGRRGMQLRLPGFPDAVDGAELVETADGEAVARAIDPVGAGRHVVAGVGYADGALATAAAGAPVAIVSPFFYDRAAADGTLLTVASPTLTGPVAAGLDFEAVVLQGEIDRAAVVAAYRAASDGCVLPGCDVFAALPPDDLEAALVGDTVGVCFVLSATPAEPGPALGGQLCETHDDCFAGLSCRVLAVPTEAGDDSSLAVRCGNETGAAAVGDGCAGDDACDSGLCVGATSGGAVCTTLCAGDGDCPADWSCRGVDANPAGTSNGGRSAKVCVPVDGTGDGCGHDRDCRDGEVCGPWLEGDVGQPGGAVHAQGRCQVADGDGARVGFRCDDPLDCAHGNGCVRDRVGELRCASPCDGDRQCAGGTVCSDRALLGDVVHGACLPLPVADGSAADCSGDLDCPVGETCRAEWLAAARLAETWCGVGDGFFAVGQRCAEDGECASGACIAGVCSGFCGDHGDCGPRLACDADGAVDEGGNVLGGRCVGADGGCRVNNDCDDVAGCGGRRCVCDDGACRIGCDFNLGVGCPGDLYCEPDDECAVFCRDDAEEPNDTRAQATALDLGRGSSSIDRRRTLCATSGTDWYRLDPGGRPIEVRVSPIDELPLDVALFDAAGERVADGEPDGDALGVSVAAGVDAAMFVRVQGAVRSGRADYRLEATRDLGACPDPADEPNDELWTWTEVASSPGANAAERIDGWICREDLDWYALHLENGDSLTLALSQDDGAPLEVEVSAVLRDAPLATLDAPGQVVVTPPDLTCDVAADPRPNIGRCRYADGVLTEKGCSDPRHCGGSTLLVSIRGRDADAAGAYGLDFDVSRPNPKPCVRDPFEDDSWDERMERAVDLLPPEAAVAEGNNLEIAPDVDVHFSGRICGRDRVEPEAVNSAADVDSLLFSLSAGERIRVEFDQLGPPQPMLLVWWQFQGVGFNILPPQIQLQQPSAVHEFEAAEDGVYWLWATRLISQGQGYVYELPYEMTLRKVTSPAVQGGDCAAPDALALVGGGAVANGTTVGRASELTPVQCVGAAGPERVYRVRTPAGGSGTLEATVVSTAQDGYDPAVHLRLNCQAAGTEVGCNEDDGLADDPFRQARATAELDGGTNVYVVVDSFDADRAGAFRLRLEWVAD